MKTELKGLAVMIGKNSSMRFIVAPSERLLSGLSSFLKDDKRIHLQLRELSFLAEEITFSKFFNKSVKDKLYDDEFPSCSETIIRLKK